jgi:hypothetical protein
MTHKDALIQVLKNLEDFERFVDESQEDGVFEIEYLDLLPRLTVISTIRDDPEFGDAHLTLDEGKETVLKEPAWVYDDYERYHEPKPL